MALALSGGEAIVVYRKIPGNKQIIPGFQNYDGDHNFLKAPKNPLNDTKKKASSHELAEHVQNLLFNSVFQ